GVFSPSSEACRDNPSVPARNTHEGGADASTQSLGMTPASGWFMPSGTGQVTATVSPQRPRPITPRGRCGLLPALLSFAGAATPSARTRGLPAVHPDPLFRMAPYPDTGSRPRG